MANPITLKAAIPESVSKQSQNQRKRGGRKNKRKEIENEETLNETLKIYYNNINGFISKRESVNQIMKVCTPDIIGLCETKLGSNSKPKIDGYEVVFHNYKRGKEGLLVAAREGTFISIEKITTDIEDGEQNILAVQIRYPTFSLRIIVGHAPQETDKLDVRERFFEKMKVEFERGQLNGDSIVVMGDMNGRIDTQGDPKRNSPNGQSLKHFKDDHKLHIANFHPNATGKWTRIQLTTKGEVKSDIDYLLLDEPLYDTISDIIVDEGKIQTPYWITTKKKQKRVTFSDHCAIIMILDVKTGSLPVADEKDEKMWMVTECGLQKYKEISTERTLFYDNNDTTDMYRQWWDHVENTLNKCFKKRSPKARKDSSLKSQSLIFIRTVLTKISRKGRVQREVTAVYKKILLAWEQKKLEDEKVRKLTETLSQFSEDEKTPPNAYWKVLKSVRGKDKTKISSVLKNDGVEVFSKSQIKHEIIQEFENRLRNRQPVEGWSEYVQTTNQLVEFLMNRDVMDGLDFTMEELIIAIKRLKKKKAPGPDNVISEFLIEAGEGLLLPLLDLFNQIKRSKTHPKQWNSVLITIIYKNKGSRKSLVNYRGIFLASIVSKVFERMLKNRIKVNMENVNLCQAGARPNRGPPDNTFILNAVIDHCMYIGKCLHITAYDFEQAFDSLWLQDCILSLRKLGIPDYLLQLIYNLNREATISVKTPFGPTANAIVKDTVQQGRVLAPDLCSASTAEYCGMNKGVAVGTCIISSLAFVDDMMDLSQNHEDAEQANLHATSFSYKKKMRYNQPKCESMAVNHRKNDPLPCMYMEGKKIKLSPHIKYIGDLFQQNGKNDELIKDRINRGTKAMLKIETILCETQFGKHTIDVALLLYRALFLSTVIFNSQSWRNFTVKNFTDLQSLQLRLLRKLVDAPSFISTSFLFLELGVLPVKYEIHQRQLTFLHHVVNLGEGDPVRVLYDNMKRLPAERNWLYDVIRLAEMYNINIDEDTLKETSKNAFKLHVKVAIRDYAFETLKEECKAQSKTKGIVYDRFVKQPYLSKLYPNQAKLVLKSRARCVNIKDHRPFKFTNTLCRWCNMDNETLEHIVNCGWEGEKDFEIDICNLDNVDPGKEAELVSLATRVASFLHLVDY